MTDSRERKFRKKLEQFKAFIAASGGEVLAPTNPYEIIRFRSNGVTSVIYRNDRNEERRYVGEAREAWDAFNLNKTFRMAKATRRKAGERMAPVDRAIIARDGETCFYCDDPFTVENPRTHEHLVSATAGGPNHISNLFHACRTCNVKVGHQSAPEKIRFRDEQRAARKAAREAQAA